MPHYSSKKTTPSSGDWRSERFLNDEPEDYKVTLANGDVITKTDYPYKSKWRKRKDRRHKNARHFRKGKNTPATEMMRKNNIDPTPKSPIRKPAEYKQRPITVGEKRTIFSDAWYGNKKHQGYVSMKTISTHKKEEKKDEEKEKKKQVEEVKLSLSEIESMKTQREKEREDKRAERYGNLKVSFEQYLIDINFPIPYDFRDNWKTIDQLKEEKENKTSNASCDEARAEHRLNWEKEKNGKK